MVELNATCVDTRTTARLGRSPKFVMPLDTTLKSKRSRLFSIYHQLHSGLVLHTLRTRQLFSNYKVVAQNTIDTSKHNLTI